ADGFLEGPFALHHSGAGGVAQRLHLRRRGLIVAHGASAGACGGASGAISSGSGSATPGRAGSSGSKTCEPEGTAVRGSVGSNTCDSGSVCGSGAISASEPRPPSANS